MTINCEHCRDTIEDLLDGTLPAELEAEVHHHLGECAPCQQLLQQEQAFRRQLSQLPIPPMRPGFPSEALAKVRQHHQPRSQQRRHGFATGFTTAMAASVAMWFAVLHHEAPQSADTPVLHSVSLSVGQVQKVNLVFNSPTQLEQATFTLLLPEHAELDGYPGRRELAWTTSLHKGMNRLSLPVRVNALGGGEIIARISHSNGEKEFHLKLDVKPGHEIASFKQA
jgi:hypothetical protein